MQAQSHRYAKVRLRSDLCSVFLLTGLCQHASWFSYWHGLLLLAWNGMHLPPASAKNAGARQNQSWLAFASIGGAGRVHVILGHSS